MPSPLIPSPRGERTKASGVSNTRNTNNSMNSINTSNPINSITHFFSAGKEDMSIRETIILYMQEIAEEGKKDLLPLTDDLVLLDSGLDSLMIAVLVARLEETLGFDPFTESDEIYFPVTLGDFIRFYEKFIK